MILAMAFSCPRMSRHDQIPWSLLRSSDGRSVSKHYSLMLLWPSRRGEYDNRPTSDPTPLHRPSTGSNFPSHRPYQRRLLPRIRKRNARLIVCWCVRWCQCPHCWYSLVLICTTLCPHHRVSQSVSVQPARLVPPEKTASFEPCQGDEGTTEHRLGRPGTGLCSIVASFVDVGMSCRGRWFCSSG